jgi:hypothetical protein
MLVVGEVTEWSIVLVSKTSRGASLSGVRIPPSPLFHNLAGSSAVQLKKDGSSLCLESTFTSLNEVKNDAGHFKAKK